MGRRRMCHLQRAAPSVEPMRRRWANRGQLLKRTHKLAWLRALWEESPQSSPEWQVEVTPSIHEHSRVIGNNQFNAVHTIELILGVQLPGSAAQCMTSMHTASAVVGKK